MKRKLMGITLGLLIALNGNVYADSLDTTYLDFLWNKFNEKTATEKQRYAEDFKAFMVDNNSLDVAKRAYVSFLSEDQKKELVSVGLSDAVIAQNFDKLKTWSQSERYQLIDYVVSGDKSAVLALNASKQTIISTSPSQPTGGGSGVVNTGGAPTGGVVIAPSTPENPIQKPVEVLKQTSLWTAAEIKKPVPANTQSFLDLNEHWAKSYVNYFVDRGIVTGKAAQKMEPNATISQAEVVTVLMKTFYMKPSEDQASKTAAVKKEWYEPFYASGSEQTWFAEAFEQVKPNEKMTREQVLKTLTALGKQLGINNLEGSLMQGDHNGDLHLDKTVTRAEFLTMLFKLVERYE